ncbi:MAG: 2'-deoxycytidine 5'-triphosphate deaminase, partial [Planktomarina temperata]|nr:2'-deoxycytidine 5'-triphosphate deaminase [Planktomarina temperata]
MRQGVIPSHMIETMVAQGQISISEPLQDDQVQPASLDLRLGHTAYRVRASFLA